MACATRIGPPADDAEMDFGAVSPDGTTLYLRPASDILKIDTYDWPALTGPTNLYTASGATMYIWGLTVDDTGRLFWIEPQSPGDTLIRRWDGSASTINSSLIADGYEGGICWYGGLLYVIANNDEGLYSVDPDTGTATFLQDLSSVAGPTATLVACPTGDLWLTGSSPTTLVHYNAITDTLTSSTSAPPVSDFIIPQASGHARYWENPGGVLPFDYWDVAPGFTVEQVTCPVVEDFGVDGQSANGQAYNPDLSVNLVQVDDATSPFARALYQFDSQAGGWTSGRVAWGSRGAWH